MTDGQAAESQLQTWEGSGRPMLHHAEEIIDVGGAITIVIDRARAAARDAPYSHDGEHVVDTNEAVIIHVTG
jgi:hypothetical protein